MCECRQGKRVPNDGTIYKKATVEVGVEVGLFINVETKLTNNQINSDYVEEQVKDKILDIFQIDNKDKVLNNICIYSIQ
jgi:hypothetical protein